MSAETGVGPAMASGSHRYSGNCALLPAAPTNNNTTIAVAVDSAMPTSSIEAKISPKFSDPTVKNSRNMASMNPRSPTRLVTKAFLPAVALASSPNQNEMRK